MSDFVVHKARRAAGNFARSYGAAVKYVTFGHCAPTAVALTDGRAGAGSCVGCGSAPCMEKDVSELALFGALETFPGDPSLDVCPTRAISWDTENLAAIVVAADCIGCGLCVARCPYGAISLAGGLAARVETADPDRLIVAGQGQGDHPKPERVGQIASLGAPAAANLVETVTALDDARATLLVRNLLNEVGLNASTRRRGDTNVRIDAVGFARSGRPFVAEIEMGAGILESPRALLEDVAVLHARYGYSVADIDPVSIILSFPNVRSEYYQVVRDIERVLRLQCRTITIGALVALLWTCRRIGSFAGDAFVVGATIDLADSLGIDEARVIEPYPASFRPAK